MGSFNYIDGEGGAIIGNGVRIGPHVCIHTANHVFSDPNIPIAEQGLQAKPVTIGNDVWIGAHAVVLSGVTIGDSSVIAAGAVVTRDVSSKVVVAGVPAREIKKRIA